MDYNPANLDPEFSKRLEAAMAAYKQATGQTVPFSDLYRDPARQAQYYANYKQQPIVWEGKTYQPQGSGGGLAAPPGKSRHQIGQAADVPRGPALDWLHQNASNYGLEFLKGSAYERDPVHVQMTRDASFNGNPAPASTTTNPSQFPYMNYISPSSTASASNAAEPVASLGSLLSSPKGVESLFTRPKGSPAAPPVGMPEINNQGLNDPNLQSGLTQAPPDQQPVNPLQVIISQHPELASNPLFKQFLGMA